MFHISSSLQTMLTALTVWYLAVTAATVCNSCERCCGCCWLTATDSVYETNIAASSTNNCCDVSKLCPMWLRYVDTSLSPLDPLSYTHTYTAMCVVRCSNNSFGDRCFVAAGPRLWNTLPVHLRQCDSLWQFKRLLKTHLFGVWDRGALCRFSYERRLDIILLTYLLTYIHKGLHIILFISWAP